ncbi:MAG: hypothetical protein JOZ87_28485 [Chloroflexi bacterium]|nr:hypothetical protein [Chloroflexota bacterium]
MRLFGFPVSVRFWVATWIVILFIGLTPQPPAVELVIVVGFVAHSIWFLQHGLRVCNQSGTRPGRKGRRGGVSPAAAQAGFPGQLEPGSGCTGAC